MKVFAATLLLLSTIAGSVSAEEVDEDLAKRILGQGEIVASRIDDLSIYMAMFYVQYKGVMYACWTDVKERFYGVCQSFDPS